MYVKYLSTQGMVRRTLRKRKEKDREKGKKGKGGKIHLRQSAPGTVALGRLYTYTVQGRARRTLTPGAYTCPTRAYISGPRVSDWWYSLFGPFLWNL